MPAWDAQTTAADTPVDVSAAVGIPRIVPQLPEVSVVPEVSGVSAAPVLWVVLPA